MTSRECYPQSVADGIVYELFPDAYFTTETNDFGGSSETRKTYYDSDGNKLGSSFENQFNEYMDGADRVRTEINYQGPDDQWLGNEYSVTNGERGYSIETEVTLTSEPLFLDLDGDDTG